MVASSGARECKVDFAVYVKGNMFVMTHGFDNGTEHGCLYIAAISCVSANPRDLTVAP